jgi:anti-anti-sigma factor
MSAVASIGGIMHGMSAEPDPGAFRPPSFDVTVEDGPDGVLLKVVGELDLVSEPVLNRALEQTGGRAATLDLSELAFMDSTGLRTLLGAARTHPNVTLQGPLQAPVQRLLELTQTLDILPFKR